MGSQSQCFPFEKSVVINALYDTIEALGLYLDKSNSARGTLIVTDLNRKEKIRIALDYGGNLNQTKVEVFPENSSRNFIEAWSPVIFDELSGRMKWLYQLKEDEYEK